MTDLQYAPSFSEHCTCIYNAIAEATAMMDDPIIPGSDCRGDIAAANDRDLAFLVFRLGYTPKSFLAELERRTSGRYVYHSLFQYLSHIEPHEDEHNGQN